MTLELDCVAGFVLSHDHAHVLLIEKQKPEWQRGLYNGVGGKIEPGDHSPYEAMKREFLEETGLECPPNFWDHFCTLGGHLDGDPNKGKFRVRFFRANVAMARWQPKQVEVEVPRWVAVSDVLSGKVPTIPNLCWLIPMAFGTSSHDWPYLIKEKDR